MTEQGDQGHSRAVEDYIKQIYKLTQHGQRATTNAIAERMSLGAGTVSGMLRYLASAGLISHERYYGAALTQKGEALALRMIRRHRLIELFLVRMVGFGWDEVDHDADRLEHAVSDRFVDRIDELLGHPDVDPHGAPIPDARGRIIAQDYRLLSTLPVGSSALVKRVADHDIRLLRQLEELGIQLDCKITIKQIDPFGVRTVRIGKKEASLAAEATELIHVALE